MNSTSNIKPDRPESSITFRGMRKFEANSLAKMFFGDKAVFKIEMDFDARIFNIFIWSDLAEDKDKNKKKMELEKPQCKIHFIKKDK